MKQLLYVSLLATLSTLFLVSSCSPAYIPNVVNTPLMSKKGDITTSGHIGTSGYDFQLAGAVTDHFGLMANSNFLRFNNSESKISMVELGSGYYTKVGLNGRFETYGGIGIGSYTRDKNPIDVNGNDNSVYVNGMFTRYFIQPTIGANTDIFQGGFAARLVYLRFVEDSRLEQAFRFEPVLTAKIGYKYLYFVIQGGVSARVGNNDYDPLITTQPFMFSIGVQAQLNLMDF